MGDDFRCNFLEVIEKIRRTVGFGILIRGGTSSDRVKILSEMSRIRDTARN